MSIIERGHSDSDALRPQGSHDFQPDYRPDMDDTEMTRRGVELAEAYLRGRRAALNGGRKDNGGS